MYMNIDDKLREFARANYKERVTYLSLARERDDAPLTDRSFTQNPFDDLTKPQRVPNKRRAYRRTPDSEKP